MWETVAALDLYRDRLQPLRSLSRPFTGTTGSAMLYVFMLAQNACSQPPGGSRPVNIGERSNMVQDAANARVGSARPESRPGP